MSHIGVFFRLNTLLGQQVMCLRPFVSYHPKLVESGSADFAKGHYGSEGDDTVSFYPQDFWSSVATAAESDDVNSPCDLFRRRGLNVVHAPEPSLRLPYFELQGEEELEKWADSLASRTQKAHVLRRWMMERGTADAAASAGGLPASSNDPDNVVK